MDVLLTIGEFSKMTYLSVKALRHYHDVGLLEPAAVDPETGYRRYASSQVGTAQAIRRFRDLDMPLDGLRQVLHAPDLAARNQAILAHLERMQQQLERTQLSVASLQALLTDGPVAAPVVEIRRFPVTPALTSTAVVSLADCGAWLDTAFADLHVAAGAAGLAISGDVGALYPDEIFELGSSEVTAFVPVSGAVAPDADVVELPAATMAVLLHEGPFTELDHTYAALGTAVAERGIGGPGAIREHYIGPTSTEVCWPVSTGAQP